MSHPPRRRGFHRLAGRSAPSLQPMRDANAPPTPDATANAVVDCGWGRLVFAHTFADLATVARTLLAETQGQRDIAFYLQDPHVVLAMAPQDLFLDPSHTYRLALPTYRAARRQPAGVAVRRLCTVADADAVNRIYAARHMVGVRPDYLWRERDGRLVTWFVAEDEASGEIVGTAMGVDHVRAFNDAEHGSSLWSLAVDPQAQRPGIGELLVRRLAEHFKARGRAFMDLSVMHDNEEAISLYTKLGFRRVPVFAVKRKNQINAQLFSGPARPTGLNPYATIIVDEARRRGIAVDVLDAEGGYFRLSHGSHAVVCRESLSELTSAVAMSRCDDKAVTRRLMQSAGISVPEQIVAGDVAEAEAFLAHHGAVVVKPARGEQGRGVAVDLRTPEQLHRAIVAAREQDATVLVERFVAGHDVRLIVIDDRLVAAAVRRPARVVGSGEHTIRELIERQSRRRAAASGGESTIPLDAETERCVAAAGFTLDDVLAKDTPLEVRKTANLHTGGTIHDITDRISRHIVEAAIAGAKALSIPVVGFDFIVPSIAGDDYVFIEANERPGLANHEPQPTAERFVDLLFPMTAASRVAA
ncbi:MAG: N-acetylglutaminylglutamine synthetase [Alphaproteobacteria bacterium]